MRRNNDDEFVYIYIPKDSSADTVRVGGTDIVKGSAIVGLGGRDDTIWYEGNIYNAINMQRYGDRLRNVADRAFSRSMSAFTGGFNPREFHRIGTVSRDYVITLDNQIETAEAIEQWTSETPAEIMCENRTFLDTRAFNRGLRKKPRFVHACLTCKNANVKQLKQEAGRGRVFCNTLCQEQYYFAKLRISESDEAGPPISDDDIIGIENKTTGRRFRLTRAQAMQLQTVADLLTDAKPDTVNGYILLPFDDYGFSVVVDFLRGKFKKQHVDGLSEQQLELVIMAAAYFGANDFNWSLLFPKLKAQIIDWYFLSYLKSAVETNFAKPFLNAYFKILPSVFFLFRTERLRTILSNIQIQLFKEYERLDLKYDFKKLDSVHDIWNVIYLSAVDNLLELQMIQKYHTADWDPKSLQPIWSAAFTAAARNGQMRIVAYLMQDGRVNSYINVPQAFSAAVAANQAAVVENLITHPSITAKEKSAALVTAVENGRAYMVELFLKYTESKTQEQMNQWMSLAAERGFEDVVVLFLNLGADPLVILERYKTPKIVQALRSVYARNSAEAETKRIKLGQRIKF